MRRGWRITSTPTPATTAVRCMPALPAIVIAAVPEPNAALVALAVELGMIAAVAAVVPAADPTSCGLE